MLFSSLNVSLMKETGALRNSWKGHGGIVGQEEARRRHLKLSEQLAKLRESMGAAWDDYPLLKPRQSTFRAGRFKYSADRIMGSRTPYEQGVVGLVSAVQKMLYVLSCERAENSFLIRFDFGESEGFLRVWRTLLCGEAPLLSSE